MAKKNRNRVSPIVRDKSNTSPFVKAVIIVFAIVLVLGIGGTSILPLLESLSNPSVATPGATTTAKETTATLAATYTSRVNAIEAELKKTPKDYDLLIAGADAYQQWASGVQQVANVYGGPTDGPLWLAAISFYQRAAAVRALDPPTRTNLSIAQFYSGDAKKAEATAQSVVASDPTFAPVHFNMGVFYSATGDNARGIAEYQQYLKLAPKGELVAEARTRIAALTKQGATPPAPSSSTTASLPASTP